MPVIRFCDGSKEIYEHSISLKEILKNKNANIIQSIIAVDINGNFANLNTLITQDTSISLIKKNNIHAINMIRRSCLQLLNYSIKTIWPLSKIANIKITNDGFYCDIDITNSILQKDLVVIEKKMKFLLHKKYNILNKKFTFQQALKEFEKNGEIYKIEFIKSNFLQHDLISLYCHEDYLDFDIGFQVFNIKFCKYFKLQKIGGVYWKSNNQNKMLQRIYGTAWLTKEELEKYLNYINEIKKRDHRKINKNLQLYHMQDESPGMIFWHNNGWIIFNELENFVRDKLKEYKYKEVKTPILIDKSIWERSGHWDNYKDAIFTTFSENREYCIKPMNCPGHVQIFNIGLKSYRDLPIRMAEFGSCHRNETSGALHGLMRVRNFTQDDAHIFCSQEQIHSEINNCIKMIYDLYSIFNFKKIIVKFSTRPKKRIGDDTIWDKAEKDLSDVLIQNKLNFEYQIGEGAFYGPKIEFILQDSLDRNWQCGTIQLDFYLPIRLNAFYIDQNNEKNTPIIIHRAILGSIERFIGILIEECSGKLPTWLCPIQVAVISINKTHNFYVQKIVKKIHTFKIRVESDIRNKKISLKIREHTLRHIPYILICGEKEIQSNTITIRTRNGNNLKIVNLDLFIEKLQNEISNRSFYQMEE